MSKCETEDDDFENEKEDSCAELPSDQSIEQQKCVEFHVLNFKRKIANRVTSMTWFMTREKERESIMTLCVFCLRLQEWLQ